LYTAYYNADEAEGTPENADTGTKCILGVTNQATSTQSLDESFFGTFFDAGVYIEHVSEADDALLTLNLTVVDRDRFSPAYSRPEEVSEFYWSCWRPNDDYLDNWNPGNESDEWAESDGGEGNGVYSTSLWVKDNTPPGRTNDYEEMDDEGGGGEEGGVLTYSTVKLETNVTLLLEESR